MKLQNSEVIDQNNSDTVINEPESTRLDREIPNKNIYLQKTTIDDYWWSKD